MNIIQYQTYPTFSKSYRNGLLILISLAFINCYGQNTFKDVVKKSNYIFQGTIVKMNASNIDIKTAGNTAIVRIDEVIEGVSPFDKMAGKDITVLLATEQNVQEGSKRLFYTVGWYYGRTLGVKEIPSTKANQELVNLKERIAKERINIHNDSIRTELSASSLVVIGTVIDADINTETKSTMESEHNPKYKKATIEIKSVLKGKYTAKTVTVTYASSDDVLWYSSPKPYKGQEAIFILHLKQAPKSFPERSYTILDKRDVQQSKNLDNIRTLLKK
jgi:hypothetical protein